MYLHNASNVYIQIWKKKLHSRCISYSLEFTLTAWIALSKTVCSVLYLSFPVKWEWENSHPHGLNHFLYSLPLLSLSNTPLLFRSSPSILFLIVLILSPLIFLVLPYFHLFSLFILFLGLNFLLFLSSSSSCSIILFLTFSLSLISSSSSRYPGFPLHFLLFVHLHQHFSVCIRTILSKLIFFLFHSTSPLT